MKQWLLVTCLFILPLLADNENAVVALKEYQVLTTPNFSIHFSVESLEEQARMAGEVLESAAKEFEEKLGLKVPTQPKISVILYESQGSFRRTSVKSSFGVNSQFGFSEPVKKRIVLWVSPSERDNVYQLRLNLAQMLVFNRLFPETDYTIFLRYAYSEWIMTGIPIYLAGADYDPFAKAAFVDALFNDNLRPLVQLKSVKHLNRGELPPSYQFMAEVFRYIEDVYGIDKIRKILNGMEFQPTDCVLNKIFKKDELVLSDEVIVYLRKKWKSNYVKKAMPNGTEQLTTYERYYQYLDFSPSLSEDGKTMVYLSDRRNLVELYKMDTESLKSKRLLAFSQGWGIQDIEGFEFPAACSPSGKYAVVKGKDAFRTVMFLINLQPFTQDQKLDLGFDDYAGVCYAPDEKSIVFIGVRSGHSQLYQYFFANNTLIPLTNDNTAKLQPSFSSDGTKVVYIAEENLERDIFIYDFDTQKITQLENPGMVEGYPTFTNQNEILFTVNNNDFINLGRTDIRGESWEILTNIPGAIIAPSLSNGYVYYSYYHNGQARLYRTPYKSFNSQPLGKATNVYSVNVTPQNKEIWPVDSYKADASADYIFPFLAINALRFSDIVGAHQFQSQFGVISGAILDSNNGGNNVDIDFGIQASVNYTFANFLTFALFGNVQLADDNDDDDNDDDNNDAFDYAAGAEVFTTFNVTPLFEIRTGYTLIYQKTSDDDFEEEEFWSGGIFVQFDLSNIHTRGIDITNGYNASLRISLFESFLGSDDSYQLVNFSTNYYWSFAEDHTIRLGLDADIASSGFPGLFDLGGQNNLRGVSEDDLEGTERFIATIEYRFPIYRDWNYYFLGVIKDLRGLVFTQAGSVTENVISKFEDFEEVDFAITVGAGLRLDVYFLENFDLPLGIQVAQRLDESDSPILYFVIDN